MLAALVAMVAGYALLALHMRRLASQRISVWQAARADLLLFGLGNVFPGLPAPGALLAAAELRRDGLSPRRTRFVLAFTMWFNVRTLLGIGAIAFLMAFARQHPGVRETGRWWVAAVGLIAALAISAALAARPTTAEHTAQLFARVRVTHPRPPADVTRAGADAWHPEAKATVGSRRNRIVLVGLAAGSWLADATCLWLALAAAGVQLDADIVLLACVAGLSSPRCRSFEVGSGRSKLRFQWCSITSALRWTRRSQGRSCTAGSRSCCRAGPALWSSAVRLCGAAVGFGGGLRNRGVTMSGLDQSLTVAGVEG